MGAFDDLIPSKSGGVTSGARPTRAGAFDDLIPTKPAAVETDEGWGSWLMGGVEAAGDAIAAGAIGSVDRVPALAGSMIQGAGGYLEGMGDAIQGASPFGGATDEELASDSVLKLATDKVGGWIRSFKPEKERQPNISMDQLWEAPLSRAIPFAIEQGLASIPDMVASVAALPLYIAGRGQELGEARAVNNGGKAEDVTFGDLMKAAPAAVASALLEKVGAKSVFGLDDAVGGIVARGAKSAAKEGATEGAQEGVEYLGEQLGTDKGVTWTEAGKRMATGALAGGVFGGAMGAGVAAAEKSAAKAAGEGFDDLVPAGAGRAEDVLDEVIPEDRERLDSTLLSEEDRASPISNDLIDDGKRIMGGERPLRSAAVQNDITFGRGIRGAAEREVPAGSVTGSGLLQSPRSDVVGTAPDADVGLADIAPQFDGDIQGAAETEGQFFSDIGAAGKADGQFFSDVRKGAALEADAAGIDLSEIETRIREDVEEDSRQAEGPRPSFLDTFSQAEATAYSQAPGVNRAIARRLGVKIDAMEAKGDTERASQLRTKLADILDAANAGSSVRASSATAAPTSATAAPFTATEPAPSATAARSTGLMPSGDGTRRAPIVVSGAGDLDGIAPQIAAPTEGQAAAGNYRKGHANWQGLQLAIETPKGGTRSGTDATGSTWEVSMPAHYGDIKGTKGADGDPVDVYVGEDPSSDTVFIVDQKDAETGEFDEHKVFVGTKDEAEVAGIYEGAFSDGRGGSRLQDITETNVAGLKEWLANGDTSKPFGAVPAAKPGTLAKKPVTTMLRKAGGVDPTSPLAGELRSMGITARTAPGLFRKGGMGAADNFVAAEHPLFEFGQDDGNGYIPEATILEALRSEMAGAPLRTADETEREQAAKPGDFEEESSPAERRAPARRPQPVADPAAEIHRLVDVYGYPDSPELRQTAIALIEQGVDPEDAMVAAAERMIGESLTNDEAGQFNDAVGVQFFPGWENEADGEAVGAGSPGAEGDGGSEPGTSRTADDRAEDGRGERPAGERAPTEEAGADGKPQLVIPGAERAPDSDMTQRAADAPLRPKAEQRPMDEGMFGSSKDQTDLLDLKPAVDKPAAAAVAPAAENPAGPSTSAETVAPAKKPKLAKMVDRLRNYFRPARIVEAYGGGQDEILSFDAAADGTWSVTVRDVESGRKRNHATPPSTRELVAWEKTNPVDEAAPKAAEPAAPADAGKIEDFGSKLEGARKDQVAAFRDSLDGEPDFEAEPLSKLFPQPDYEKLAEAGVDPRAMATIAIVRAQIPAKPRKGYKVKTWAAQVQLMRQFARELLDGRFEPDAVLLKMDTTRSLSGLRHTIEVLAGLPASMLSKASAWHIRGAAYTQLGKERFSPAKTFYSVINADGRSVYENGEMVMSADRGEIVEKARELIQAALGSEKPTQPAKRTPIQVYTDRRTKTLFIGFKGRSDVIRLKTGFETVKDARAYIVDHADELQANIDAMRVGPQMRREVNRPREGVDRREGDVSPELFQEAFGFRGVQFGNYVEADRRQFELNEAFDGLMDLADTLGLPPQAISLNGSLGLAFGARGRGGAAKAHYEPGHVAINLTKSKGAGSLAHEWFHGLDHYFAKQDAGKAISAFMSERQRAEGATRDEVFQAWKGVESSLTGGAFSARMAQLDAARSKEYWNTTIEKAARGFERYVTDRIESAGGNNDYLANIDENAGAYPNTEEMKSGITAAFDNLFETIDTRQTDQGTELFSERSADTTAADPNGLGVDFRKRAEGWETVDFEPEPRLSTAEQDAVVEIVRRVSGLSEVQFHDAIRVPTTAKGFKGWGREGKPGEVIQVAGFYHSMKDVIAVALNTGGDARRLAFHESFHRLQSMFLTDQEKALLQAETKALRAIVAATDGREEQATRMSQIEIEAEAFAIYAERMEQGGRAPLQIKGRIRVAWDRIRGIGRRVKNYLNGRGYQTFEDVFDMARSGDMKARVAENAPVRADQNFSMMRDDDATDLAEVEPQRKTAGFLAKGQPIDRALRIPFEIFGGTDAKGEWKPGKYLTAKAAKIITEAKFAPEGRMSWMNGALETARAGLIDRYGLDAAYIERDQGRALDERAIMFQGVEVLKSLAAQNVSVQEAKVLQAILTGETVDDADMMKLAEPIRVAIDELGQEAVQLGLLSAESYERNRGAYLHRVYLKHEADQSGLTKMVGKIMGGSRQKIIGDQFKGRGMFFEVPMEAATRNLAEVVKQRREDAEAKSLGEKLGRLADRRKVAAARLEESQSESAVNMARRMDIAEAARQQKGGPGSYQKGQMREQGVAMNRLRKKAEQANRVLSKIDAEADAIAVKLDGLKSSRVMVGKFMPVKGEKYTVLDKRAVVNGKERVVDRAYIPSRQSVPAAYRDYVSQGTWEVRGAKGDKVVLWRDYTKDERGKMGEILDARYTIGKTYLMMAHDLATGRFYQDIAANPEWASKDEPAGSWKEAADTKRLAIDGELQWVRVPDTTIGATGGKKRWGALAGQFVRAEIWRDLNEIEVMNQPTAWRMLLSQWKLNKTARSPVTHMNNVMSNLMFMDMADVRAQDLVAGIRAYAKGTKDYDEASKHGAFGVDMMAQEIRQNFLQPILDELTKSEQDGVENSFLARAGFLGKLADQIWTLGKAADAKMIDAYRVEDEVFRMATYMRRREMGDDARTAAKVARETFMDYDIRAPWVNAARNTVLPFASYTYRAAPMIAKSVAARPWKIAKYATIAYALNALAYAFDDEGDEERERASLRDEEQGKTWLGVPRMMRMPFRNEDGLPVFLDVRRWMPAGDIFDTNQGSSAIPIPSPLQFGGPLLMGFEIALNKQGFTGEEITNREIDTTAEQVGKVGDYLWKGWLPSAAWIPGSWYWDKLKNAAMGATDGQGRPYDLPSAMSSSIGIKLKPQDVESGIGWQYRDLEKVETELKAEAKRLARQRERGLISQSAFDAGMATFMEKLGRVGKEAEELQRVSGG